MNSSIGGDSITRNEFSMDPTKHIFASGMSGMDKSTILVSLFTSDGATGGLFVDPHGDTADQIANIPTPFCKRCVLKLPDADHLQCIREGRKGNSRQLERGAATLQRDTEEKNFGLNRATINGLIVAFGDDSALWTGQVLTAETERVRVAGKAVTAVYLAPEGYERMDYENGYTVIVKKDTQVGAPEEVPSVDF